MPRKGKFKAEDASGERNQHSSFQQCTSALANEVLHKCINRGNISVEEPDHCRLINDYRSNGQSGTMDEFKEHLYAQKYRVLDTSSAELPVLPVATFFRYQDFIDMKRITVRQSLRPPNFMANINLLIFSDMKVPKCLLQ